MDSPMDLAPDFVPQQPTTLSHSQQHQGPQPTTEQEAVGIKAATDVLDVTQRDISMDSPSEPAAKQPPLTQTASPASASAPTAKQAGLTALERQTALNMLNILSKYKEAEPFRQPVDWEFLKIPEYPLVITQPMDLRTCREKVRGGAYDNIDEWKADVQRIWDNCRKFNGEDHFVTRQAEKLQQHFERRMGEAQAAAARDLATLQQRAADGAAAGGSKGPSKPKTREVAQLGLPSASDGDSGDDRLGLSRGLAGRVGQRSPEPLLRLPLKRAASASNLQGAAAAAAGDAGFDVRAAVNGAGRAHTPGHKRRVTAGSGGNGAAGVVRGLDLDALEQLSQTPAAKQLGIVDTDDLAFLALWKRVTGRKQQALQDLDSMKSSSKKADRHLKLANDRIAELADQVEQERTARQLAEQHLQELQQQHSQLQDDFSQLQQRHQQQDKVLDQQKAVLEQQQQVLRTILQQQRQQQQSQGNAPTSASVQAQAQVRGPPAAAESPPSAPASALSAPVSSGQQQQQQQQQEAQEQPPSLLPNQPQQVSSTAGGDEQQHQLQQQHNHHLRQQQGGTTPDPFVQDAVLATQAANAGQAISMQRASSSQL